jgi:hypothetical protein
MSRTLSERAVLELLEGDVEVIERLEALGYIRRPRAPELTAEEAECARVARTLVRELDVNWAGVDVVLRMRAEMLAMRRQVAELVALLRSHERR